MTDNNALAAELVAALDRNGERLAGLLGDLIATDAGTDTAPDSLDDPPDSGPMTITPTRCGECEQLISPNVGHVWTGEQHLCLHCVQAIKPDIPDGKAAA